MNQPGSTPAPTADSEASVSVRRGLRRRERDTAVKAAGRRRRRRMLWWIVLALLVALAAWTGVERLTQSTPATRPPSLTPPTSGTGGALGADSEQARVAVEVENAFLAGDTGAACSHDEDPARCLSAYPGQLPVLALSTPVSVVQVQALASGTGVTGSSRSYVGVVVQRQIEGQTLQRKAFLLTANQPVQVASSHLLGSADAGQSLAEVFSEELR